MAHDDLVAAGGFVSLVPEYFEQWYGRRKAERDEVWPNYVATRLGRRWRDRLHNFFAWDKGWGFPLRGGIMPTVRDLMPVFRVDRGGICFGNVYRDSESLEGGD